MSYLSNDQLTDQPYIQACMTLASLLTQDIKCIPDTELSEHAVKDTFPVYLKMITL